MYVIVTCVFDVVAAVVVVVGSSKNVSGNSCEKDKDGDINFSVLVLLMVMCLKWWYCRGGGGMVVLVGI